MCRSVARGQPRVPPRLSRYLIEQGGQCTHHFFYRPVAVGGNAPLASMAGSWTVATVYALGYRFALAPTGPSTNPRGWYGVGLSDVPPWDGSQVEAPRKSNP